MRSQKRCIGINTLFLIPNKVGGTEYYTRSFLQALQESANQDDFEFVVFCNQENFASFTFSKKNWRKVLCPVQGENRLLRVLFEQLLLPFWVWRLNCQVLHSFGYVSPLFLNARSAVTVHDANWKDHPGDTSWLVGRVLKFLLWGSLQTADTVFTDSQFAADRLRFHFPSFAHKFVVLEPGVDPSFEKLLQKPQTLPSSVAKPYILCISALYPHKKISYLLDLWQEVQQSFPDFSLILVGNNGSGMQKIREQVAKTPRVQHFPKVSFTELVALYQYAHLGIFPSVYEGFGFPVYESLAADLPTIVGNKKCYSSAAQSKLEELTFDLQADSQRLAKILHSLPKKRVYKNFSHQYQKSAQQLLQFYKNLSES